MYRLGGGLSTREEINPYPASPIAQHPVGKSEKMDLGKVPWIGRGEIADHANSSVGNKLLGIRVISMGGTIILLHLPPYEGTLPKSEGFGERRRGVATVKFLP